MATVNQIVWTLVLLALVVSIFGGVFVIGPAAITNFQNALSGKCSLELFCNIILSIVPENQRQTLDSMLATSNITWFFILPIIGMALINYAFLERIFSQALNMNRGILAVLAGIFALSAIPLGSFVALTAIFYSVAGAYASYMFVALFFVGIFALFLQGSAWAGGRAYSRIAYERTRAITEERHEKTNLLATYKKDLDELVKKYRKSTEAGNESLMARLEADIRTKESKINNLKQELDIIEEKEKIDLKEIAEESKAKRK